MSYIDRYVAEVGRSLPAKNRADVERELRSLLEDALDDAAEAQDRPRDAALELEVLKKFGSPAQMAASYGSPNYLIGPKLYPTFLMVLRIVLAVILVISAFSIGIGISQGVETGQTVLDVLIDVFAGIFSSLMAAFGNVVLVFAVLERLLPEKTRLDKEWDPKMLVDKPDEDRVNISEPIVGTVFLLAALVLLNVYPEWVGLFGSINGTRFSIALLAPAFFTYLPVINVLLALEIGHNALLVQQGRWTNLLRWLAVGLAMASAAVLVWMMTGPALIQFDPAELARVGWDADGIQAWIDAGPSLLTLTRIGLGVALGATILELGQQLYRIFGRRVNLSSLKAS